MRAEEKFLIDSDMIELKEKKGGRAREKKDDGKFIHERHYHRQMMTIDTFFY